MSPTVPVELHLMFSGVGKLISCPTDLRLASGDSCVISRSLSGMISGSIVLLAGDAAAEANSPVFSDSYLSPLGIVLFFLKVASIVDPSLVSRKDLL